jgi:hypothetical protein
MELADHVRQLSRGFEKGVESSEPFSSYRTLFNGLRDHFDLGVYSLNYDTVALTALPDFFTGFDTSMDVGRFAPAEIHRRYEHWGFLYHLHGSVHHSAIPMAQRPLNGRTLGGIVWMNDLSKCSDDRGDLRVATDQRRMVPTTLIAGNWKLDQIQEDPFQTFYSSLPRHAHEADVILIGGYGFGDAHINNVLSAMLAARSRRPPVLVLGRDTKPSNLTRTLSVPGFRPVASGGDREFETSTDSSAPAVFWSGGVEGASVRLAEIIGWLDGNQSIFV